MQKLSVNNENDLNQIANILSNVWNKYEIKITYKCRFCHGQDWSAFNDTVEPFFDEIDKTMSDDYIPAEVIGNDTVTFKTNHVAKLLKAHACCGRSGFWL